MSNEWHMSRTWITTSSTRVGAMVNSINAACEEGFVPDHCYFLDNPEVEEAVQRAIEYTNAVVEAYGGDPPTVHLTSLEDEIEFDRIRTFVQEAIEEANARGDEVAVDITPGRKFMSAIAFAAGMRYGADHVYYFYLSSYGSWGGLYPEIPRSAIELIDFVEGD